MFLQYAWLPNNAGTTSNRIAEWHLKTLIEHDFSHSDNISAMSSP